MPNLDSDVVITDGVRQYFRPSIHEMRREIKHEVSDYKANSLLKPQDSYEDLTLVNQGYDRVCYVRKRIGDIKRANGIESVEVLVLLGLEHKLRVQLNDVQEFINHYKETIHNIKKKLKRKRIWIQRFFCSFNGYMSLMQNLSNQERKLDKFEKEKIDLEILFKFTMGKVLFHTDRSIAALGILKEE